MKLYLSGPVTQGGILSGAEIEENIAIFHLAHKFWESQGHEVVLPPWSEAFMEKTWAGAMKHAIHTMLGCDAIALLPDHGFSRGAMLELHIAEQLGYQILHTPRSALVPGGHA